jgi:hypothetical protein
MGMLHDGHGAGSEKGAKVCSMAYERRLQRWLLQPFMVPAAAELVAQAFKYCVTQQAMRLSRGDRMLLTI